MEIIIGIILILLLFLFSICSIIISSRISREEELMELEEFIKQYEEINGEIKNEENK